VAIENQYNSVGRATLRGLGLGPTEIARVTGLSKQCIYNYLTGRAQPDEKNAAGLEERLGIPATSWHAHRPVVAAAPARKSLTPSAKPAMVIGPAKVSKSEVPCVVDSAPRPGQTVLPETPALPSSNAAAETGVSLIRSSDPHEARRDLLLETRDTIRILRQQIAANPAAAAVASLASVLNRCYKVEADILDRLANTESQWVRSAGFKRFYTSLYKGLEPIPGGTAALLAAVEGHADAGTTEA
jgi:hypothetical protein